MLLVSIPSNIYNAQPRTFETPDPLDPTVSTIRVTMTRENWPGTQSTPLVTIGFEVALDGVTYPPISGGSGTANGGIKLARDGVTPITAEVFELYVPGVGLTTRKVRATLNNLQTLRTAVTVEAF